MGFHPPITGTGSTGYTGPRGPTGYTGYTGPGVGSTGPTGYTGYTGPAVTGYTGYTGFTGAGNFTGYTGYSGYTGYTGPAAGTFSSVVGQRQADAASGSVTYAHGLGATPLKVTITMESGAIASTSVGTYSGAANAVVYSALVGGSGSSTSFITFYSDVGGTQTGAVTAVDGTNVTISWVKTSAPGSVAMHLLIETER